MIAAAPLLAVIAAAAPGAELLIELVVEDAPVLAGDPLRVEVRLVDTAWLGEADRVLRRRERGESPERLPPPAFPEGWEAGVALVLERLEENGSVRTVLAGAAWDPLRRPSPEGPASGVRRARWLALPEESRLHPGRYRLTASWTPPGAGTGEARRPPQVDLLVARAAGPAERAMHHARVAAALLARDRAPEARLAALRALEGPAGGGPEMRETWLVLLRAESRTGDHADGVEHARALLATLPPGQEDTELAALARRWVRWFEARSAAAPDGKRP